MPFHSVGISFQIAHHKTSHSPCIFAFKWLFSQQWSQDVGLQQRNNRKIWALYGHQNICYCQTGIGLKSFYVLFLKSLYGCHLFRVPVDICYSSARAQTEFVKDVYNMWKALYYNHHCICCGGIAASFCLLCRFVVCKKCRLIFVFKTWVRLHCMASLWTSE